MGSAADDLQIKLKVTSDEHPALHRVLCAISDPRRRTRRLKELASTGLLVERSGAVVLAAHSASEREEPTLQEDVSAVVMWDDKAG